MEYKIQGENTNFNDDYVKSKSREDFIELNKGKRFQHVSEEIRLQALGHVWDLVHEVEEKKPRERKKKIEVNGGVQGHTEETKGV